MYPTARIRLLAPVFLLALGSCFGLATAGDASVESGRPPANATSRPAVLDQRLVVLEEAGATGQPAIAETRATALAASYLATSSQATGVRARYATVTLRGEDGQIAWGIPSRRLSAAEKIRFIAAHRKKGR